LNGKQYTNPAFDRPQALGISIWVAFSQFILMNTCKGFRNISHLFAIDTHPFCVSHKDTEALFKHLYFSVFITGIGWVDILRFHFQPFALF